MNDVTGSSSRAGSVLLTAAAFVVIVAGMRAAESIVVPFLLSVFIAIISAPSLFWLERKGLPRWLAMLVVIGVIIAAGIGVTVLVGTSIREFSRDLPEYRTRINAEVLPLLEWLRAKGMDIPSGGYMSHLRARGGGAARRRPAQRIRPGARQRVPDLPHRGVHPVRDRELPAQVQRGVRRPRARARPVRRLPGRT